VKGEKNKMFVSWMRPLDKLLLWLGLPYVLTLAGAFFMNRDNPIVETAWFFGGYMVLMVMILGEKKKRRVKREYLSRNRLIWLLLGFGIGYFLLGILLGVIVALAFAFVAHKYKLNSTYPTAILTIGWCLNIKESFQTNLSLVDKLFSIYSTSIWRETSLLLLLIALFILIVGGLTSLFLKKGEKDSQSHSSYERPRESYGAKLQGWRAKLKLFRNPLRSFRREAAVSKEPYPAYDKGRRTEEPYPAYGERRRVDEPYPAYGEGRRADESYPAYDEGRRTEEPYSAYDERRRTEEPYSAYDERRRTEEPYPVYDEERRTNEYDREEEMPGERSRRKIVEGGRYQRRHGR
jgi:flagellar basal body-associated protein FliL